MRFAGVPIARVATRARAPEFVAVAATPATAAFTRSAVMVTPEAATFHAALAPQSRPFVLMEPAIADRLALMPGRLALGVPRDQLTVPVAPSVDVSDTTVFEDPHDASKKFFVMGYRLAEETTTRGKQFAVRMTARDQGWELSLSLGAAAPDAILQANPGAQPLPHEVALLLRYHQRVNGQPSAMAEANFTATSADADGIRATLAIPTLAKRDEIYHALTDPELSCVVIVRRVIQVAVPAPTVAVSPPPPAPAAPPRAVGGRLAAMGAVALPADALHRAVLIDGTRSAAPVTPPVALYRSQSRALDLSVPFTFDPALNRAIFEGLGAAVPGASQGLLRKQISWNGQPYVFYQDDGARNVFYYLPDTFKIARRSTAPHEPVMSVRFESEDGSKERVKASCTYCAVPVVNRERLASALPALEALVPADILTAAGGIELEPLLPDPSSMVLKLAFPGSTTNDGPFAARPQASVDLRSGIVDALTVNLDQFRAIYEALFSTGQLLFSGVVAFDMGGTGEQIPFQLRMHDTAEPFARWTHAADGPDLVVSMTNEIESPLRARHIDAVVQDGATVTVKPLTSETPYPVDIAPGASAVFRLPGASTLTVTDLDLSDVSGVPDKAAIYDVILDPSTPPAYERGIQVKTFKPIFDPPVSAPQEQLMSIVVDFEDGTTVELRADQLEATVKVPVPLAGFILGRAEDLSYRYKVTAVRLSGATADDEWQTGQSGILFPRA